MLDFLLLGAGIGLVAGLSPGPVLTLVVAETLRAGWARGVAIAAGPLLADGPIVVASVLLVSRLPPAVVPVFSLLGGIFLLYLGVTSIVASRGTPAERRPVDVRRGLLTGALARVLSPNPYLFWFLVGAPLLVQATRDGLLPLCAFLSGYYCTIVGSNVVLAVILGRWTGRFSRRVERLLLLISGALLAVYGASLLNRSRQGF